MADVQNKMHANIQLLIKGLDPLSAIKQRKKATGYTSTSVQAQPPCDSTGVQTFVLDVPHFHLPSVVPPLLSDVPLSNQQEKFQTQSLYIKNNNRNRNSNNNNNNNNKNSKSNMINEKKLTEKSKIS